MNKEFTLFRANSILEEYKPSIFQKLGVVVFITFTILKLCSLIEWSWWIISSPLLVFIITILLIVVSVVRDIKDVWSELDEN